MTTSQYPQKTLTVNWKAIIFWGIILGLICFGIYQYRTPILAWIQKPSFNVSWLTLDKITQFLKDYGVLITAGAAGFTFIYGVYQKHQANKAATQLLTAQQNTQTDVNKAYDVAEQYRLQTEKYKLQLEQTSKNGLSEALSESQNLVSEKETQIKSLQSQLQALQDMLMLKDTKVIEKQVVK